MRLLIIVAMMTTGFIKSLSQAPKHQDTVTLDGNTIYYEVYGEGQPLFLLHGFTQSSQSWRAYVADYEKDFEVYLVDLKGHGRSGWFSEPLSLRSVAQEVNALINYLSLDQINAIGFSYGGDVLVQLALLNPGVLRSMIIIGSCGTWHAKDFPEFVEYLSYRNIDNLPWMREQQTSEEQIKSILAQVPNYDVAVTDDEFKSIRTRTLLVVGDKDDATPIECVVNAKKLIPTSFLWVVPNTGHLAHRDEHKAGFVRVSKEFLSGKWE